MKENKNKPLVLIVDDIEDSTLMLEMFLGEENYNIKCATSVEQAIQIMGEGLPDIILTDLTMPEVDGFDFMRMIKNNVRTRDIPILVTSGLENIEDKQKAFELGAVGFLGKPYDRLEITNSVAINVKLRMMQQELEAYNKRLNITIEQQYKRIEEEQKNILVALANIVEIKQGRGGRNRLEKLAYNAQLLAQCLELNEDYEDYISQDYVETIHIAALLHDIGKIGVSSPEECDNYVDNHAEKGAQILEEIYKECSQNRFLNMAIYIARYHHHDYKSDDPDAVQGEDLPVSARIMRIIDDFDKLVNSHNDGKHWSVYEVLDEMKKDSGIKYDPVMLEVFEKIAGQVR